MYKEMSKERLDEEIEALFDIIYAVLEAQECDSIENFPNPNVRLKFSCEVLKDESKFYC